MSRRDPRRIDPGPGQESVWDYPRPPACVRSHRHVVVRAGDVVVADTSAAFRVLETSHPPTWYLPRTDVDQTLLRRSDAGGSFCEWKGQATYWDVVTPDGAITAKAWSYEHPTPGFVDLAGYLTFYPSAFTCTIDGEVVRPQEGGFYGGWITDDVAGRFKGGPGTWGW